MKMIIKILLSVVFGSIISNANEKTTIYISQVIDHPSLDSTRKGIIDYLNNDSKFKGQIEIKYDSAQGNPTLAQQIANSYISNRPKVVVGIGTLSSQSFTKYVMSPDSRTSLVFASVTDPSIAGIENKPNITGVSNFVPIDPQIEIIKKILPNAKKIAVIYNPGELNSVSIIRKLEASCRKYNILMIQKPMMKSSDAVQVTSSIGNSVDAIMINNDNTALSAVSAISNNSMKFGVPLFVSDTDAVSKGAIAALGPDQYEIGKQAGKMIEKILSGSKTSDLKIEYPSSTQLVINRNIADKLKIKIPKEILDKSVR